MSERTNNPERIYLEPPPYSPEGRQWCADDVWPLDGDGPGGVEYVRADLATPEPGGEGETLESRAYEIAHWIATEARVAESLDRSVAPIESEGARRIVALASARPTAADVREPTDAQINVWSIIRSALSRAWALSRPWAVADRPQVTSEVVARLDAIAADCEREVRAALRSEAQGEDELAALVVHMWQLKEQRGPMYTESGDFYVDFRRAYELAAARTNGGSDG